MDDFKEMQIEFLVSLLDERQLQEYEEWLKEVE